MINFNYGPSNPSPPGPPVATYKPPTTGVATYSGGNVLGSSTGGGTPTSQQQQYAQMAAEGSLNPIQQSEYNAMTEAQRRENEAKSAIESGYSSYEQQLDAMLNEGLPGQQAGLETQASAQLARGQADILSQKEEGVTALGKEETKTEQGKTKTLKDIYTNLRNSFMAGNVYLGAQGAGDSSAAGMLSYALNKIGSKQTGDVISQFNDIKAEIGARRSRLDEIYNKEKNNLQLLYDEKIGAISQWFYEQQNSLRQQKGQLGVSKGQDLATLSTNLLNQALQELNFVRQQAADKQNALDSWALSNSTTLQEAEQKLAAVANYQGGAFQAPPLPGVQMASKGSSQVPYTPGSVYTKEEQPLFGGGASGGYGSTGSW